MERLSASIPPSRTHRHFYGVIAPAASPVQDLLSLPHFRDRGTQVSRKLAERFERPGWAEFLSSRQGPVYDMQRPVVVPDIGWEIHHCVERDFFRANDGNWDVADGDVNGSWGVNVGSEHSIC